DGRLVVEAGDGDEFDDIDVALIRQHKEELIDLIFCPPDDTDSDYDLNERAAIQAEGCTLTVEPPETIRPKLVVTMAEVLAHKFSFDELQERCEIAYRKGVHHALSLACEIAETARNHDAAIDWLERAEAVADELRFNSRDEGRGMLLETIRERISPV